MVHFRKADACRKGERQYDLEIGIDRMHERKQNGVDHDYQERRGENRF
jgi:hypothetical protein